MATKAVYNVAAVLRNLCGANDDDLNRSNEKIAGCRGLDFANFNAERYGWERRSRPIKSCWAVSFSSHFSATKSLAGRNRLYFTGFRC